MVLTPIASPSSVVDPFLPPPPLRTVHVETSPIPAFIVAPYPSFFRTATYPHVAVKGSRAIIVWERRAVPELIFDFWYTDSNIVGKFTDDDGASFSDLQTVSSAPGPQFQPSICVDNSSGSVVVAYYSRQNDPFLHLQDVYVATSSNGAAPFSPLRVTPSSNDTEADPVFNDSFFGDYLEVACRGGKGVVHYTGNYRKKETFELFGGSLSLFIRQQDNFIGTVSLP